MRDGRTTREDSATQLLVCEKLSLAFWDSDHPLPVPTFSRPKLSIYRLYRYRVAWQRLLKGFKFVKLQSDRTTFKHSCHYMQPIKLKRGLWEARQCNFWVQILTQLQIPLTKVLSVKTRHTSAAHRRPLGNYKTGDNSGRSIWAQTSVSDHTTHKPISTFYNLSFNRIFLWQKLLKLFQPACVCIAWAFKEFSHPLQILSPFISAS